MKAKEVDKVLAVNDCLIKDPSSISYVLRNDPFSQIASYNFFFIRP
ncbi:MAG: hypothetical protein LC100_11375 [Chitinophagales bacterium]|nr:hypothetical protein [Chitinophagales bacterium]